VALVTAFCLGKWPLSSSRKAMAFRSSTDIKSCLFIAIAEARNYKLNVIAPCATLDAGGERGRGQLPQFPCPCPPAAPRRNFDGDKVLYDNHTHAKVRLIKCRFCKRTHTSVTCCVSKYEESKQICGFHLHVQKLKVFELQGGFAPPWPTYQAVPVSQNRSAGLHLRVGSFLRNPTMMPL